MSRKVPENNCPTCNAKLSACTPSDGSGAVPTVGDVTVCFYCGEVLEFEEGMTIKPVEIDTLVHADFVQLGFIQRMIRAKNNGECI